jgi:hypothetical protein
MTTKSSFAFSVALAVFVGAILVVAMPVTWLQGKVEPRSELFRFNSPAMSADGTLTFLGHKFDQNPPHWQYWTFDESLQKPVVSGQRPPSAFVDEGWKSRTANMTGDTENPGAQDNPARVQAVHYALSERRFAPGTFVLDRLVTPLVWWNRPAGQFDVYDRATRLRQGSLSMDGVFVPAPGRPAQRVDMLVLRGNVRGACFFATRTGVFRLDLPMGPVHPVFNGRVSAFGLVDTAPAPGFLHDGPTRTAGTLDLLVRSGGELLRLNPKGEVIARHPHPALKNETEYSVTFMDNGRILFKTGRRTRSSHLHHLLLMEPDGKVVRNVTIDEDEITLKMNGGVHRCLALHAPTLLPPVPGVMTTAALAQSVALSLALCGVVVWHQARRGVRGWRRTAWPAFAFVGGILGALTYCASIWDERAEPCPACGKRRVISADLCAHCAAAWPRPKELGIEIKDGEARQ